MNKLQKEADDRNLHPFIQKEISYADKLPDRVKKRMLEEEVK